MVGVTLNPRPMWFAAVLLAICFYYLVRWALRDRASRLLLDGIRSGIEQQFGPERAVEWLSAYQPGSPDWQNVRAFCKAVAKDPYAIDEANAALHFARLIRIGPWRRYVLHIPERDRSSQNEHSDSGAFEVEQFKQFKRTTGRRHWRQKGVLLGRLHSPFFVIKCGKQLRQQR